MCKVRFNQLVHPIIPDFSSKFLICFRQFGVSFRGGWRKSAASMFSVSVTACFSLNQSISTGKPHISIDFMRKSMVSMDSPANKPTRNYPACLFLKTRAAKKHLGHPFSLHRRRRFRCHPSRWCASAAVEILMGDPHRKSMENTQTIHGAGIFTYIETP